MRIRDLASLTATEALLLLRAGDLTSVKLTQAYLGEIQRREGQVAAWVHLDSESALLQAARIDAKRRDGQELGALAGVSIGVKDIFNTVDMPTQMGSPIWRGFTPGNDARVVHYLRMADAIILGKTVSAEFAVHTPGSTRNPHHPEFSPGTSSSGSAAAVAAHMIPVALGTQTAGSIIRPASYCGVMGMKPSFGLVPRTGMLKTTDTLDTVGFFARCADDLELALETIRVHGRDYPVSEAAINDPTRRHRGKRRLRVALVEGYQWDDAEPYARVALHAFASRLVNVHDLEVEIVSLPTSFSQAHGIHEVIYDRTLAYYFGEEYRRRELVSELMYSIIERGQRISLPEYVRALEQQSRLAAEFDTFATTYDLILALSTGGEAPRGLNSPDRLDSCLVWTLCGAPVVSLPVFVGPNGLPFGAQIIARRYSDYALLDFVRLLESSGVVTRDTYPPLPV